MQIYNTSSTELSIIHETWDLCDADINSYPLATAIRRANSSLETLVGDIIESDGLFQWDDTNQTTLPIGKGDLVEGQEWYSFAAEYLDIIEVAVLNTNNVYTRVDQIDPIMLGDQTWEEYFGVTSGSANKGFPEYYDLHGDSIRFGPAPTSTSVTLTNGLRIKFRRTIDLFTTADTTQEPGIPSPWHITIAYMMAIPYCMKFHPDRVALYQRKVDEDRARLREHFSRRDKDVQYVLNQAPESFI